MSKTDTMSINGEDWVKADSQASRVTGNRRIVVLDRGWIFVGQLETNDAGVCTLRQAFNLRRWKSGGFGGVTLDPNAAGVEVDACADVVFSVREIKFSVPIREEWNE